MSRSPVLVVAAALALAGGASRAGSTLTFKEVAPGIHAGLQPHAGRFDDANALVVIGEDAVLIVDAPARPDSQQALIAGVRALSNRPVRYLVNTHWHGDHTQGNAALRRALGPPIEILGHASLAVDVPGRAAEGDVEFLPPDRTYEDRLVLELPPHRVELLHLPGHTRGDTVVWIPTARVAASGDLVDDLPYVGHGFPRLWAASLERLRDLPWAVMVPGHGPEYTDRRPFIRVRGFVAALLERAAVARAAGRTLEELQARPGLDAWRSRFGAQEDPAAARFFDGVLDAALERAWRDLEGGLEAELAGH